jgi:hypothetical protein
MRVIDHPTPNALVVGSAAGGLYAYTVTGWELSRDEYGSEDVKLMAVPPHIHTWRVIDVESLPSLAIASPTAQVSFEPITTRDIPLRAFYIDGKRCCYGFDRESVTFFVQEG